jgi:hypothetical protein
MIAEHKGPHGCALRIRWGENDVVSLVQINIDNIAESREGVLIPLKQNDQRDNMQTMKYKVTKGTNQEYFFFYHPRPGLDSRNFRWI